MKITVILILFIAHSLSAQGTPADYHRAAHLAEAFPSDLAVNIPGQVYWIGKTSQFWYRKSVPGGHVFMLVDAQKLTKQPAFDHTRLAEALSAATGHKYQAVRLPFEHITFTDHESAIEFYADEIRWKCGLADFSCTKPPSDKKETDKADPAVRNSPDDHWEAFIRDHNLFLRAKGKSDVIPLSREGSEAEAYDLDSLLWSPDSRHIAVLRVHPGYQREVHYIESSPKDQLQPKHFTRIYRKPGDDVDIQTPVLFDVATRSQIILDKALFPDAWDVELGGWFSDSRRLGVVYNQRGHQRLQIIAVNGDTGQARVLISEESRTFIDYRPLRADLEDSGKFFIGDMDSEKDLIWASERDGWEHLYRFDSTTGALRNQITKGNWPVRSVEYLDKEKKQIWFTASGYYPGQDPYFLHYFRIDADGSNLTAFTSADGNHDVRFSADREYYVDTWSRPDLPPISELRRTRDRKLLLELERGDISKLLAAGWHAPEPFSAKGRDGQTDIWGLIYRPSNFDPAKKYPVIENIYAGPQGSDVPKFFSTNGYPLAELGFIVVQIDGMGTNNRSRAFHDVTWKNLADGGFPDRILWHKAVAARYPWYDIGRMGIYGGSAGGQHALGGLLFHGDFYKVGIADSGCHDNRMDKIWWNEQWMGWPVGPEYAASSNVENAARLKGKLMLIVGELDQNVDPSSTLQVVNSLIKANKQFDLLYVPGGGHAPGGEYAFHRMEDFFVHNLLGVEPPDWNQ